MKLHIIFAQEKCSYPGQHAPQALDIADEYTMEENPEWLEGRLAEHRSSAYGYERVEVIIVSVPSADIDAIINPMPKPIPATVLR